MKIETKYDIGQRIWIVYEHQKEVQVYEDFIANILIDEDNKLLYCSKESYEEYKEEDIILYEETEKLVNKIKEVMKEIKKNEKNV
jgi:hypothetical protein